MNITVKDLELLVNDSNKVAYISMYDIILDQFENALQFTNIESMTEERQNAM